MQGLNIYTRGAFGKSMNNLEQMAHVYLSIWNTTNKSSKEWVWMSIIYSTNY